MSTTDVDPSRSLEAISEVAAMGDVTMMRRAVRVSALPLYLVRLADAHVLEASRAALGLAGWGREHLGSLSLLRLARSPEHLERSFELLASGGIEAFTRRGALELDDGTVMPVTVHYQAEERPPPRAYGVGAVLGPTDAGAAAHETGDADRVSVLEHHLRRIADEVRQAGVTAPTRGLPTVEQVPELALLTARELDILGRLLLGDRVRSIAADLYLSESTVRNHLTGVFRKLGVGSQPELLNRLRGRTRV